MATRTREDSICDEMSEVQLEEANKGMEVLTPMAAPATVSTTDATDGASKKVLSEFTLEAVIKYIKDNNCKNIVTMVGAGISTSADIPDFRSPDSGIYNNLEKYNLPSPYAIFTIAFFEANPEPFFQLAKESWPKVLKPTPCHYFIRKLHEKGLLLRHYTQNIDTLEHVAGIPNEKVVEAHGTFNSGTCRKADCSAKYTQDWLKGKILADEIPKCEKCESVVKPDVILFGENLPQTFYDRLDEDMSKCDVLIILGTSLTVQPFASVVNKVPGKCPRLYINKKNEDEEVEGASFVLTFLDADNTRDVAWWGECDTGCQLMADQLGWGDELKALVKKEHSRIDGESAAAKK